MRKISTEKLNQLQEEVAGKIPKNRYFHTLGVAYLASSLAMCYGIDPSKAMAAGLLHDIVKYVPGEEAVRECKEAGLPVSELEERNTFLLHGKLGAYYAKEMYGIDDEEILSSIEYHTTGKPEMTLLEQIIFLSDYIEIRRNQPTNPDLDEIRMTAFKNIELAVYYALDNTLNYLTKTGSEIDPLTKRAQEFYKKELML